MLGNSHTLISLIDDAHNGYPTRLVLKAYVSTRFELIVYVFFCEFLPFSLPYFIIIVMNFESSGLYA